MTSPMTPVLTQVQRDLGSHPSQSVEVAVLGLTVGLGVRVVSAGSLTLLLHVNNRLVYGSLSLLVPAVYFCCLKLPFKVSPSLVLCRHSLALSQEFCCLLGGKKS